MEEFQCKEFTKYLLGFGITSASDILFDKQSNKKYPFSEKNAIGRVKEYLFKSFSNSNKLSNICSSIYERYIDYDDESVTKLVKRLLIIYTLYHRKCLNNYMLKWKFNVVKLSIKDNTSYNNCNNNSISIKTYTKKKINNAPINHSITSSFNNKSQEVLNQSSITSSSQSPQLFQIQIANEANFSITDRIIKQRINRQRMHSKGEATHNNHRSLNTSMNNKPIKHNNTSITEVPKTPDHLHHNKPLLTLKDKEELFSSLYNDSKSRKEKLRQMQLEKEQNFNSQYTFTPLLATRAKSSDKYRYHINTPFIERLQTYNKSRKSNLKKIEREVIESLPKPKQFKKPTEPQLISRSQDYKQQKEEKIRRIESTMLQEQGVTFKPILNDNINAMIPNSVIDRNEQFLKQKQAKLIIHRGDKEKECSFKPKINETSSSLSGMKGNQIVNTQDKDKDKDNNPNNANQIGQRLYEYHSKYMQNLEEKKVLYHESYPFKPSISKNTDEILENKRKIMEELQKRYDHRLRNENIQDEETRKETDDPQANYKMKTLNDYTGDEGNNSLRVINDNNELKKCQDKINALLSLTDERRNEVASVSTEKCDSTHINTNNKNTNTKITSSVENFSDEKLLELARNYISIDESLEKFQLRYKKKFGTNEEKLSNQQPIVFKDQENDNKRNGNTQQSQSLTSSSTKGPKVLMRNMNYYDNLC